MKELVDVCNDVKIIDVIINDVIDEDVIFVFFYSIFQKTTYIFKQLE